MNNSDIRQKIAKRYGGVDISNTSLQEAPDQPADDFVRGVLGNFPAGIIGPAKSGKTGLGIDLAVCVAAGSKAKFLNHFSVYEGASVLYLAYEGNKREFEDRVRRVKQARGVDGDLRGLTILSKFPQLNTESGLSELDSLLNDIDTNLVIVDCLYAGFRGIDLRQLSAAGGVLADFHDVCRENFATPLIVHHTKRDRSQGLSALSGAGLAEWVGQWMLLNPVGRYDPSTGHYRMRLEIGSRAGFGGCYMLDVREGRLDDPCGRVWDTMVSPVESQAQACTDRGGLRDAIVELLRVSPGKSKNQLRRNLKRSSAVVTPELEAMEEDGIIATSTAKVKGQQVTVYSMVDGGHKAD
jgi:hypothetical protein